MKKQKKVLITVLVFLAILLSSCNVFAADLANYIGELKFSEEFVRYINLSDEEKKNVIAPRAYDIPKTKIKVTNPLKLSKMLGTTLAPKYSLKDVIPANMVVKNQMQTNSCWAFANIGSLESVLALKDYNANKNPVTYNFSERHMEYATSKTFLNNEINEKGFNREVGDGGCDYLTIPYLTNGTGAIAEEEMPFENNENKINISEIQNKNVITEVNDITVFPSYSATDDKTQIKQQMKEHIKNYGGINAAIHGASLSNTSCYNNETGAIYCDNQYTYPINHAVMIVGWDDNYSKSNFSSNNQPQNDGAWIIRNSWGADVGDNGFMYVSYEDVNIYRQLDGIVDAQYGVDYENIYQYDQYAGFAPIEYTNINKVYLATVFDKKTKLTEYLTQVSIYASETYTCKVYVNPNGTSKKISDLQQVQLKVGESETFDAGYHTLEFLNPIKINSDSFVVVLEIKGMQTNKITAMMEFNYGEYFNDSSIGNIYNNVTVESEKCFWSTEDAISTNQWVDCSKTYTLSEGRWPNFDTTIKAFTTSEVLESIEIATPPTKTSYIVGEDFDPTGMVVKANYANGTSKEITDYNILNGTELSLGQTSVTISYNGKTTSQTIEVEENSVESLAIKTSPSKTEYWAGEDFDSTGMVVEATYKNGATEIITDYTVQDGKNLKNGQTSVTISYEGKTVTQSITVNPNEVVKIEIKQVPNKVKYVIGQNFDPTGMIVEATYENGAVKQVEDYIVKDGENLQLGQTTVTIEYEGKTATQSITVENKTVTSISIKTMPTKTEYIQNKEELDLTGGVIEINYNDSSKEEMSMTSEEITASGFDNKKAGKNTITLTYKEKTVQFDVTIKEETKPQNSNFDNIQGNVTRVRAYYFTDKNKKEYTVISVNIDNIVKASGNDKMEYYYYLSTNSKETNIENWVKIDEFDNSNNKLSFEINTSNISNYEEISNANNIYLYVKEVATLNNIKQEKTTSAIELKIDNTKIEEYVDGKKKAEVKPDEIIDSTPGDKVDNTLAPETLPKAGRSALIFGLIVAILVIGRIAYIKYKNIEIK